MATPTPIIDPFLLASSSTATNMHPFPTQPAAGMTGRTISPSSPLSDASSLSDGEGGVDAEREEDQEEEGDGDNDKDQEGDESSEAVTDDDEEDLEDDDDEESMDGTAELPRSPQQPRRRQLESLAGPTRGRGEDQFDDDGSSITSSTDPLNGPLSDAERDPETGGEIPAPSTSKLNNNNNTSTTRTRGPSAYGVGSAAGDNDGDASDLSEVDDEEEEEESASQIGEEVTSQKVKVGKTKMKEEPVSRYERVARGEEEEDGSELTEEEDEEEGEKVAGGTRSR